MSASLVALVRNMPLERKVWFHFGIPPAKNLLFGMTVDTHRAVCPWPCRYTVYPANQSYSCFGSAAPHAEPQADAGFSSGFGSAAPHAEPQADADFSSGFGSAAPHAEPQADAAPMSANAATFSR